MAANFRNTGQFGPEPFKFPEGYSKNSFLAGGAVDTKILDEYADKIAVSLIPNPKDPRSLTGTKVRQYFGEARRIEKIYLDSRDRSQGFKKAVPLLAMMRAKVAYDTGRDRNKMSGFNEFIKVLTKIGEKGPKEFEAMMLHFEAVLAYITLRRDK